MKPQLPMKSRPRTFVSRRIACSAQSVGPTIACGWMLMTMVGCGSLPGTKSSIGIRETLGPPATAQHGNPSSPTSVSKPGYATSAVRTAAPVHDGVSKLAAGEPTNGISGDMHSAIVRPAAADGSHSAADVVTVAHETPVPAAQPKNASTNAVTRSIGDSAASATTSTSTNATIAGQPVGFRRKLQSHVGGQQTHPVGHGSLHPSACGCQDCVGSQLECGCGAGQCGSCGIATYPQYRNAQEYICDGGDQNPSMIVRKDWSVAGLEPTDTVMHYETLEGKQCITPTNRVCIYSPRFGAVRQVTGAVLAEGAVGTERVLAPIQPHKFEETDLAGTVVQPLGPESNERIDVLDAFKENNLGIPVASIVPPQRMSEVQAPVQTIDFFSTGVMLDHEIPVLGRILANAREWYTPESLGILVDGQEAALVIDTQRAQDVHVYDTPDGCSMRICKAASHSLADSGETVNFTIRFDNVGTKTLGNAVILDSLSPRLEYIENSQQCSVDARFTVEPNEVGSVVLRWEIENPIEAGEGGVVSFDCLVR